MAASARWTMGDGDNHGQAQTALGKAELAHALLSSQASAQGFAPPVPPLYPSARRLGRKSVPMYLLGARAAGGYLGKAITSSALNREIPEAQKAISVLTQALSDGCSWIGNSLFF